MPDIPHYWTINSREFRKIKNSINILSMELFERLKVEGFDHFNSPSDYLGCWISKSVNRINTKVAVILENESPRSYSLELTCYHKDDKDKIYRSDFGHCQNLNELQEFARSNIDLILKEILFLNHACKAQN